MTQFHESQPVEVLIPTWAWRKAKIVRDARKEPREKYTVVFHDGARGAVYAGLVRPCCPACGHGIGDVTSIKGADYAS